MPVGGGADVWPKFTGSVSQFQHADQRQPVSWQGPEPRRHQLIVRCSALPKNANAFCGIVHGDIFASYRQRRGMETAGENECPQAGAATAFLRQSGHALRRAYAFVDRRESDPRAVSNEDGMPDGVARKEG